MAEARLSASREWAYQEFGAARLGRADLTRRLVTMASRFADSPSGILAKAFMNDDEREGAYRFVENPRIAPEMMAQSAFQAAVSRCEGMPYAFIPVDGSSLRIWDEKGSAKGTGPLGPRAGKARGFQVMSALAVSPAGVPQGLCGQSWWKRAEEKATRTGSKRKVEDKETKHWLNVMASVRKGFEGSACLPWLQLDRGGDAWPVLLAAHAPNSWLTVRASYSRRLRVNEGEERQYLWPVVQRSSPIGKYSVQVTGTSTRKERTAVLTVRACEVTLDLRNHQTKKHLPLRIWAVMAQEMENSAGDEKPLEWMLLTTFPAPTFEAACTVLFGYTQRWRIEEFHKAWKSGICDTEDTQLQTEAAIRKLAIILSSVATRVLRVTYMARVTPTMPASVEFTSTEIRAAALLKGLRRVRTAGVTIAKVTTWIAEIGGYTGRSSGGPPGMIVLARGLRKVSTVAMALRTQERIEEPEDST
jgi:hypothetical protein